MVDPFVGRRGAGNLGGLFQALEKTSPLESGLAGKTAGPTLQEQDSLRLAGNFMRGNTAGHRLPLRLLLSGEITQIVDPVLRLMRAGESFRPLAPEVLYRAGEGMNAPDPLQPGAQSGAVEGGEQLQRVTKLFRGDAESMQFVRGT